MANSKAAKFIPFFARAGPQIRPLFHPPGFSYDQHNYRFKWQRLESKHDAIVNVPQWHLS